MAFREGTARAFANLARMILKLKRTPGIFLVGFMGCGKSTVGPRTGGGIGAGALSTWDADIEKQESCSIAEIFDQRGETAFRVIETAALRNMVRVIEGGKPHVVALGGGAFLQENNLELVAAKGVSIGSTAPLT